MALNNSTCGMKLTVISTGEIPGKACPIMITGQRIIRQTMANAVEAIFKARSRMSVSTRPKP